MEKLFFTDENGTEKGFFVEAEVRLNGSRYILVSEDADGDEAEALILKDISTAESEEAEFELLEDEREIDALLPLFAEIFEGEDIDFEY
ncbi:MAG: DUF1292 domain-containing protein [Lachnospiraceae bacterium]|jgi:hypothetical protein